MAKTIRILAKVRMQQQTSLRDNVDLSQSGFYGNQSMSKLDSQFDMSQVFSRI